MTKSKLFYKHSSLNCCGKVLDLSKPIVMGIVNATPDSFYDGGKINNEQQLLTQVEQMIADGVSIIDVGGMSSRPGAEIIDKKEEASRIIPVVKTIHQHFPDIIMSIDTVWSKVAQAAFDNGATIVNDISAGSLDSEIWTVAAQNKMPYVLMHMQGKPNSMQQNPVYNDVVLDVLDFLSQKVFELRQNQVNDIIIDLGFGFGKTIEHNFTLLNQLNDFSILECPMLVGISRKSMIYKALNCEPKEALNGTTALNMSALMNGANILRVHDVKAAMETIKLFNLLND